MLVVCGGTKRATTLVDKVNKNGGEGNHTYPPLRSIHKYMTKIDLNSSPFFSRSLALSSLFDGYKIYAIDTETYYDRAYNMANGLDAYINHPLFELTVFSMFNETESYSGDPSLAPVEKLNGAIVFAHNVAFDQAVVERAIELGKLPPFKPARWICTMDMAKYMGYPGALDKVSEFLLGIALDKKIRDEAKGWTKDECLANKDFVQYCMDDASSCYWIGKELSTRYPAFEERISQITRMFSANGIMYDRKKATAGQTVLSECLAEQEKKIPWPGPATSLKQFDLWCKDNELTKPESTNTKDPRYLEWAVGNVEGRVVVERMSLIRKIRKLIATLKSLDLRVRDDGRVSAPLKYWGAHTGRWSGSSGVNFQGLAKKELLGVNVMGFFVPDKGNTFIQFDFANIEPRVLLTQTGDEDTLNMIRSGMDIYEAHARSCNLYNGEEPLAKADPELRQMCKARVLGLGYGCGAKTFKDVASSLTGGKLKLTEEEAFKIVYDFRKQNPLLKEYWYNLEKSLTKVGPHQIPLPSGRPLRFEVKEIKPLRIEMFKGRGTESTWGAKLCENVTQAIARDVLADCLVKLAEAELKVLVHVHDSVVIEVAKDKADETMELVKGLAETPPDWLPNLPLQIDIRRSSHGL